ncbi:MAG: hypothetical protein R3249_10190, partial [Nitriliruptorales bacterium]|nr:hypothetical protein [Nitriliruptorales bacterium]
MTTRMATLAGAAIALLAIATPAGAVEDALTADELGLVVEVGFGGRQVPGDTMPVTIEITPTGLFEGVIEVTSTTNTIERIPVEATAGATRRFHVLSPGDSPPRISIIPSDGREPLVRRPRVEGSSVALAGVVGTVPAGFPIVADAVTGRPIVPVAIEPVWLPHGPPALASLAVLVIDADRLRDLSADATAGLAAAVTAGLDLVVTVGPDAEPGLGLPWSPVTSVTAGEAPGTAAVTVAPAASPILVGGEIVGASLLVGQGQLAVVGAHLGTPGLGRDTGFWEPLLSAGPRGRSDLARGEGGGIGDVRLPSVGLLTLFLLGYVIVVGPVTGLGLSRLRRPELAWVVVPAVTLAFSGAAFVLASASQPSVALVTRTLAWADGAGMETASLLLRAPRQGSHDVRLPGDWTVSNRGFNSSPRVTHEPGHTRVDIDLEALQAATFDARRPLEQAPPLEVTARLLDGAEQVEVAVTNTSDATYDRLMILAGGEVLRIDEPFGPGESTTWTVAPRVMAPW